jgi:hypothetical protein
MSSDDKAPERVEQPTLPDTPESKTSPNYSLAAAWVQGGTRSSEHDKMVQKRHADAERRRKEQDDQRKLAGIPVERGGARLFSAHLTDVADPRVLIQYGEFKILCELVKDDPTGDRILTLTCVECVKNGAPEDMAQFHIRQGHRAWHIDESDAGKPMFCEDTDYFTGKKYKRMYISAGVIKDAEPFRCPNEWCGGVRYQIDNNVMRRVYLK